MIEIIGRQGSHYTRMARLLAHELGVDYTLRPIYDLLSEDPAVFGGNPALKLPALRQNGTVVWGSQNVCRALARSVLGGESFFMNIRVRSATVTRCMSRSACTR